MKPHWFAALAALFVLVPYAGALQTPDVTFIPEKISINSSFIMIADAHPTTGETITSAKWVVFGVENGWGDLSRKIGTKRARYFSNTDPEGDGPNIFPSPSYGVPYELEVNISSSSQTVSALVNVDVGSIEVQSDLDVVGTTVMADAWVVGTKVDSISYKVYDSTTLSLVKSGSMTYNNQLGIFRANITSLPVGDYYISFSTVQGSDFGGGVAPVTIGGQVVTNQSEVKVESISYMTTIRAGQTFTLKRFTITNTGMANLTGLSISVPQDFSAYLDITPEKISLEPNESTYMIVTLRNIQTQMNISLFASLYSGATQKAEIPVNLVISTIGGTDYTTCDGRQDMEPCISSNKPGVCCGDVCRQFGECCSSSDCTSAGDVCTNYQCIPQNNNQTSDVFCTSGICRTEGCYSDESQTGESCVTSGISGVCCTSNSQPSECQGQSDMTSCTGGKCCSESCITDAECCTDSDCESGKTCSYLNVCESEIQPPPEGPDIVTIAMIGGGVAIAALVGLFVFKRFRKKGEGEEEIEGAGEGEEDEFSDEDFY